MPLSVQQPAPAPLSLSTPSLPAQPQISAKQQTVSQVATTAFTPVRESAPNIPIADATNHKPTSYEHPLTASDVENIHNLFTKLAETSVFMLAYKKSEMEILGKKLDSIHPLAVWKHVMKTPQLKQSVNKIKSKSLVWNTLLKEYSEKIKRQYTIGNLTKANFQDFLHSLNRPADRTIDAHTNWKEFLACL